MTTEEIIDLNETPAQIKARLKVEFPTLKVGCDENGYVELTGKDYDAVIQQWTDFHIEKINVKKAELAKAEAKAALLAKLAITEEEAKLLLG